MSGNSFTQSKTPPVQTKGVAERENKLFQQVDYLRISLIDRCNFRCQYCMPEGVELDYIMQQDWLTHEELLALIQEVFIPVGFTRFRLNGGEPLLRPGVVKLVRAMPARSDWRSVACGADIASFP